MTVQRTGNPTRDAIVTAALTAVEEQPKYVYDRHRPFHETLFGPAPRKMDCSEFCILCYKEAGAPDPGGGNFDGTGSSYTMADHCQEVDERQAQPGDLVIFDNHVVLYLGAGRCVTMGKPGEPIETSVDAVAATHELVGYYRCPGV